MFGLGAENIGLILIYINILRNIEHGIRNLLQLIEAIISIHHE